MYNSILFKQNKITHKILEYRYLKRNFVSDHFPRYHIWSNFVIYVIRKYSAKHLIRFMNRYSKNPKKEVYISTFNSVFNKNIEQLFKDFLNSIR